MLQENVDFLIFTDMSGWIKSRYAGPYRVASEARLNGYRTQVVDYGSIFTLDEIFKILEVCVGDRTLAIGFSTTFTQHFGMLKSEQEQKRGESWTRQSPKLYNLTPS